LPENPIRLLDNRFFFLIGSHLLGRLGGELSSTPIMGTIF
jgi:hypothetical protein